MDSVMNAIAPYIGYVAGGIAVLFALGLILSAYYYGMRQVGKTIGLVWSFFLFGYPLLIYVIGGTLPALREVAENSMPWNMPDEAFKAFVGLAAFGAVVIVIEVALALVTARVMYLIANMLASIFWGLTFLHIFSHERAVGNLQYYEMLSCYIAVVALAVAGVFYLIGAWNKNPTQVDRGSATL